MNKDAWSVRLQLDACHDAYLQEFIRRLLAQHGDNVLRVRVFGSRARGDASPGSDLDLLVNTRDGPQAPTEAEVWDLDYDVVKELTATGLWPDVEDPPWPQVIVASHAEWLRSSMSGMIFPCNVESVGVDLYRSPHLSEASYVNRNPPQVAMVPL